MEPTDGGLSYKEKVEIIGTGIMMVLFLGVMVAVLSVYQISL